MPKMDPFEQNRALLIIDYLFTIVKGRVWLTKIKPVPFCDLKTVILAKSLSFAKLAAGVPPSSQLEQQKLVWLCHR